MNRPSILAAPTVAPPNFAPPTVAHPNVPLANVARRGLTLIEVVAATVLLTLLAASGVSLIRAARASIEAPVDDSLLFDLGVFADAFVEDPERFGVITPLHELADWSMAITWRDGEGVSIQPQRIRAVQVRTVRPVGSGQDHFWLVFQALSGEEGEAGQAADAHWSVSRLVALPPAEEPRR